MLDNAPSPLNLTGRSIGPGSPAFVIAEIGVNHDGSEATAMRLVEAAWEGGADAVKLQLFSASRLVHPRARLAGYQRATGAASPAELLRKYELDDDVVGRLVKAIGQSGMIALATPFSPADVTRIARLGLPAIKLASPDLTNDLLLDAAGELNVPLLLSTGASTQAEVGRTVDRLNHRGTAFALLHCVSSYPTPDGEAGLSRIAALADRYEAIVGYSDHTQNLASGALAVAAGAKIVEKHLTHSRSAKGPDHSASADPRQFAEYVNRLREAETLLGDARADRRPLEVEADVRAQSRQSLVTTVSLRAGEPIVREALTCQRPGTGIPASKIDEVIAMVAVRDIPAGAMLDWTDLDVKPSRRAA